jgi:hypothetical protein
MQPFARLCWVAATPSPLKVPIIELELDARLILASGPAVIGFLVLVLMGSLRAFSRARDKLGLGKGADWRAEAFDTYPNAIDLALYTTPDSPKSLSTCSHRGFVGGAVAGV